MIADDRWTLIKALFDAALERPPEERAAFLQQISLDSESRAEVERLLAAHLEAGAFIERSALTGLPSIECPDVLIGQLVGHYRIEHRLGAGGMGIVYAARDLDLKRVVALKIVASDLADRQTQLRREAQRASQLNHPNVCTIHEVGVSDGMTYFVMERVEGRTLSELITEHALALENVLSYGSQIAEALAHAHAHGLVHRDLKSSNVMVTRDGRIKVLDFGIACSMATEHIGESTVSTQGLSREGLVAGTLPYLAPELLRAEHADARSDLWALGVVLYEMAARRRPFEGSTGFEVSAAILCKPPPPLPVGVPPSLEAIIRRLLAKIPGERYAHAGEAAAAIEAVRIEFATRAAAPRHGPPGDLPVVRTSFVGRVNELASVVREVESSRLVTLTGVGGSGKTRLALETAERMRSAFPDGVWWVDLAPIADETRIAEAIASTLRILNAQRPPRETLLEYVGGRRLLIVLDNCEHLIAAAADLADAILANARDVHLLATSREGLGVSGERILPVPSLSIAGPEAAADLTAIANCDAVRLFATRATAVQPRFSITSSNAPVILEICRRLDGIPLAVELAAARARFLSVEQIRTLLGDRLARLSRRGGTVPRHQTLGAALQWSYDLLTAEERRTLRVLAVFHGGWTLSEAAAVCGETGDGDGVLDVLWRLVDKSLVEVMHTDGVEARYRLLEMVRQFALDQLIAASEASSARDRHAEYYVRRLELAAADLLGPREPETVAALDLELDNLLAALHHIAARDEGVQRVLRAVSDGWLFWVSRGRIAVARGVLASAIQRAPDSITPAAARALMASSMLARFAGDSTQALGDAERSVSLYRHLDCPDPSGHAFALFQRAGAAISFTPERAMPRRDLERGIELSITVNDEVMRGICLNMLSGLDLADGNIEAAEARLVEALSTARTTQSPYLLILYLANLASMRVDRGRWLESVALEREAIELVQRSGNRHFAPFCVLVAARILAASGDLSSAYRLSGAAFGMWVTIGERPTADDTEWMDRLSVPADESRREEYARLQEEGRTLAFDAAVAEALRALQQCSQSVHRIG